MVVCPAQVLRELEGEFDGLALVDDDEEAGEAAAKVKTGWFPPPPPRNRPRKQRRLFSRPKVQTWKSKSFTEERLQPRRHPFREEEGVLQTPLPLRLNRLKQKSSRETIA